MKLGLVSDTHGLLRPELIDRLGGVDHILHAGDIGDVDVLTALEALAPVTAVWGNTDGWEVRHRVPEVAEITLEGTSIVVVHGQQFGSPKPADLRDAYPSADLIVFGHTHQPVIERTAGCTCVNPGSAGPRRFRQPTTCAIAELRQDAAIGDVRIVPLLE